MKVGNWPAGMTKYTTATMTQIIARMYAIALMDVFLVEQSDLDFAEHSSGGRTHFLAPGRRRGVAAWLIRIGHAFFIKAVRALSCRCWSSAPNLQIASPRKTAHKAKGRSMRRPRRHDDT